MLLWIGVLTFGVPLVVFIVQMRAHEISRQDRLAEIQKQLQEKQQRKIMEKRAKIEAKNVARGNEQS